MNKYLTHTIEHLTYTLIRDENWWSIIRAIDATTLQTVHAHSPAISSDAIPLSITQAVNTVCKSAQ